MFISSWQKRQVRPAILESPLQCRMNSIAIKCAENSSMIQFVLGNWKCIWQKQSSFMRLPIESILNSIQFMAPFYGKTTHIMEKVKKVNEHTWSRNSCLTALRQHPLRRPPPLSLSRKTRLASKASAAITN